MSHGLSTSNRVLAAAIAVAGIAVVSETVVLGRKSSAVQNGTSGRVAPAPPAAGEKRATVIKAPDSPVSVDRATVFTTPSALRSCCAR